jgi:DNA-directed RNA polymerase subunit RPC12/RpoP
MKQFENLEAVTLYCRQCGQAMPVRKRLLLVLLDHEVYEYLCAGCGSSLGKKKEPLPPIVGGSSSTLR